MHITVDRGRYLGEHSCNNFTYGDQTMVRECCVADALHWRATAERVAFTTSHPAYKLFEAARRNLTDAEITLVPALSL